MVAVAEWRGARAAHGCRANGDRESGREATMAMLLSLLAVPRIYPFTLSPHSRCSMLELGLTPSLDSHC